jgi:hypothetical protein
MRRALAVSLVLAAATLALLWFSEWPLGVPGEWEWQRLSYTSRGLLSAALLIAVGGIPYLAVCLMADRDIDIARRAGVAARLLLLVAAACGWLIAVQAAAIEGVGLAKSPAVLFYQGTEGYFWHARYESDSVDGIIGGYDELMAERDYLHIGTHPPGLMLGWRMLLDLCQESPNLVALSESTQPESIVTALQQLRASMQSSGRRFTREDGACLWLGVLATNLLAALTVVPLFGWVRLEHSRRTAWRTSALWPLVPALAVFLPKSDLLYPCLAMTAAWLWRWAWLRGRLLPAFGAGLVLCGGMLLSLAFLPVAALLVVQSLADGWPGASKFRQPGNGELVRSNSHMPLVSALLVAGAIGFLLPVAWLWRLDLRLPAIWWSNFENHALFYDHNVRNWWRWLQVNPVELALAAGVPVVVAAVAAWWVPARGDVGQLRFRTGHIAFSVIWGLLWLSGKNMGEAARLWILLLPWLVACAAPLWEPPSSDDVSIDTPVERGYWRSSAGWIALLVLQLLVGSLTVLRIDGFQLSVWTR